MNSFGLGCMTRTDRVVFIVTGAVEQFTNSEGRAASELEIVLNLELRGVLNVLKFWMRFWDDYFMQFKAGQFSKYSVISTYLASCRF